jgi:hypothetical protein
VPSVRGHLLLANLRRCLRERGGDAGGDDVANPGAGSPAYCGISNLLGGGTGWLVVSGNVTPGETIEVRFAVWDTSDHLYDSVVLLDDWEWSETTATPGTQ